MKKSVLILKSVLVVTLISLLGFNSLAESAASTSVAIEEQQETKEEIEMKEVPESVQNVFSESYNQDSVLEIYRITKADSEMYNIIVNVENEKWTLLYSFEGELLDKGKVVN